MDRPKHGAAPGKRGSKSKSYAHLHGDLIALGAKPGSSEPKHFSQTKPGASSMHKPDKKSDSNFAGLLKKHKSSTIGAGGGVGGAAPDACSSSSSSSASEQRSALLERDAWHSVAVEPPSPADLPVVVAAADASRAEALLCGCVRWQLAQQQRNKLDPLLCTALLLLVKSEPALFCSEHVLAAFCSLLRREPAVPPSVSGGGGFKTRTTSVHVQVLAANVLLALFRDENHWPETFVAAYLDDAAAERSWVDSDECRLFVDNVVTAFGTRPSPRALLQPDITLAAAAAASRPVECPSPPPSQQQSAAASQSASAAHASDDHWLSALPTTAAAGDLEAGGAGAMTGADSEAVRPRYSRQAERVREMVVDFVGELIGSRKQPVENLSRNTIRLLAGVCGIGEVRQRVVSRLEVWLHNPKWSRPAQELLLAMCCNAVEPSTYDADVIAQLVRFRLKAKPVVNLYLGCIRELLTADEDNLPCLLRHTIYNELSVQARNPHNMVVLAAIFQHAPRAAATVLAQVFLELLVTAEDYSQRALRPLWREICRALRYEVDFQQFCVSLLQERRDDAFCVDFEFRERYVLAVCELVAVSILLSITPTVKEAVLARQADAPARAESAAAAVLPALLAFHAHTADIQCAALQWLHVSVPHMTPAGWPDLARCVYRVLFMEPAELYHRPDNWPPEADRALVMRIACDVPASQESLLRVLLIGLSKTHALPPTNALEVVDNMVRRAALCHQLSDGRSTLSVSKPELIDLLFNLALYHPPESISLPPDYRPPPLAMQDSYWRVWMILLLLVAHHPQHFGQAAWQHYATLRSLIEMCITNSFVAPSNVVGGGDESTAAQERQLHALETRAIIEYERHLAAGSTGASISESSSLLVSQLISLEPSGPARTPPASVLEQIRLLNGQLRVGQLLCASRQPDFLLDILQRQESRDGGLPWLYDLVTGGDSPFTSLPVQCLCEFLLGRMALNRCAEHETIGTNNSEQDDTARLTEDELDVSEQLTQLTSNSRHAQLLTHLQTLMQNRQSPESDGAATDGGRRDNCELVEYLVSRLSSQRRRTRLQATRAFRLLLLTRPTHDSPYSWPLHSLPALSNFARLRPGLVHGLRIACHYETHAPLVAAYIDFLATHASADPLPELAETTADLGQLVVERSSIMNQLLPCSSGSSDAASTTTSLADGAFGSLLAIFSGYMKQLRKRRGRRDEAWPDADGCDQVIVRWGGGDTCCVNCLVVHATVILLCCPAPTRHPARDHYSYLQQLWFPPPPQSPPRALDESAPLFPDWLLLRMVRGANVCLAEAALVSLQPAQLVLFIQSFGVPVASMARLLDALDAAVERDASAVLAAVMNRQYMCQLVDVQRRRGAAGGLKFAGVLRASAACADDAGDRRTLIVPHAAAAHVASAAAAPVTALAPSQVTWLIRELFGGSGDEESTSSEVSGDGDHRWRLRSLQRGVALELRDSSSARLLTRAAVTTLAQLLAEDEQLFVRRLQRRSAEACCLLRLLTSGGEVVGAVTPTSKRDGSVSSTSASRGHQLGVELARVCRRVGRLCRQQADSVSATVLCAICDGFVRQLARHSRSACIEEGVISTACSTDVEMKPTPTECETSAAEKIESIVLDSAGDSVERRLSVAVGRGSVAVADISRCLLQHAVSSMIGRVGVLVDWLETLEPDVIGSACDHAQVSMLFATCARKPHNENDVLNAPDSWRLTSHRSYLLALLTHRAAWPRLQRIIDQLLTSAAPAQLCRRYDASLVLDFVHACRHVPRLWQGRESSGGRWCRHLVVGRRTSRAVALAHYMVTEAATTAQSRNSSAASAAVLKRRLDLLLLCFGSDSGGARDPILAATLRGLVALHGSCVLPHIARQQQRLAVERLLLLLYLHMPRIVYQLPAQLLATAAGVDDGQLLISAVSPAVDRQAHSLLTAIAATRSVKEGLVCMRNYEAPLRKLVSTHAPLMLRHVPLMTALLQGRVDVDTAVFRRRNEPHLFGRLLSLLHLLVRRVFATPRYARRGSGSKSFSHAQLVSLAELLHVFLCAADRHAGHHAQRDLAAGRLASLVTPLAALIIDCGSMAPATVVHLLRQHGDLVSRLADRLTGEQQAAVRALAALTDTSGGSDCLSSPSPAAVLTAVSGSNEGGTTVPCATQLCVLRDRLNAALGCDEITAALYELDAMSSGGGACSRVLELFVDDCCALVSSSDADVRDVAHKLLYRHLVQRPDLAAERCVAAYLRCLCSEQEAVRTATLHQLPRVIVLCQQHAVRLLLKAFDVAVASGVNVTSYVCDSLARVNLQWGL